MDFFAWSSDFWRMLNEEFVQIRWISPRAGREKFGTMVAQFLTLKRTKGVQEIGEQEKQEFMVDLQTFLQDEAKTQHEAGKITQAQFNYATAEKIEEIAETHKWWEVTTCTWKA